MKQISLIAIAVFVFSGAMAQDDTLGKYPYFFYNTELPGPVIYHDGITCQPNIGTAFVGDVNGNIEQLPLEIFRYSIGYELATQMHTDDTLHIVGIAYYGACDMTFYSSDCEGVLNLYDSALTTIKTMPSMYHTYPIGSSVPGYMLFYYNGFNFTAYEQCQCRLEFFPDSDTIDVVGDFYVGGYWSNFYPAYGHTFPTRNNYFIVPYVTEDHEPPYAFPERHFKIHDEKEGDWVDYTSIRSIPMIFPIIVVPCAAVDSVALSDSIDTVTGIRTLSATWDSLQRQTMWVVTVEDAGGTAILSDTVTSCHWQRQGFDPDAEYSVSVLSRCDSPRPSWSTPRNAGIVKPSGFAKSRISVQPNPTRNRAVLHVDEPLPAGSKVTICDQGGRILLSQKLPAGCMAQEINTSNLAPETYIIHLTTPDWTATSKLVIIR